MFPETSSLNLYDALRWAVNHLNPSSYLEIGVREGASLGCVLNADSQHKIRRVALCDTWGCEYGGTGRGNRDHIVRSLQEFGYPGLTEFYDGDSKVTVPKIQGSFDLILVDGDHSEPGATQDMKNAWDKLSINGAMVIDDLIHPAHLYLQKCVDDFIQSHFVSTLILRYDIARSNGVAVLQKTSSH
jgi:hypothetical protein